MERVGRRSLLQTEILAQLRKERIDSISSLARSLEKRRPAVSRALKTLSDQGIVQRVGRSWSLTELGSTEAEKAVANLQESTTDIVEIAGQRFRAMNRAGLGDNVSASMASLLGADLGNLASAMMAERMATSQLALMAEAMIPDRSVVGGLSGMGSVQEALASLGGLSAARGAANDFGLGTASGALLDSALREAAFTRDSAEELITSLGTGSAIEAAKNLGAISAGHVGESVRELSRTLAEGIAESFGVTVRLATDYSAFSSPNFSALLSSDFSALSKSVDVIAASREQWPPSLVDAALVLAEWEEPFARAISSLGESKAAQLGDILSDLACTDLPEPLLSDALRVYGLNSERIHTPTYWIPPLEPVESIQEARLRASAARRRRINDAADTLAALEQGIRTLIATQLSQRHGLAWWKRSVPPKIREECAQRKADREAAGGLSHDPIDYTYTNDLKDIILKGDNWGIVFSSIFRNKTLVEAAFLWIEPVRKDIAHSRPSSDRDYKQFKFAATWLTDAAADALDEGAETDAAD